jgi:long-chain acyl-CoA synthetase
VAKEFNNLVELYLHSCETYGSKPALATKRASGWSWTTFSQLHAMIDQARGGLQAAGVARGDMVSVISNNRLEWAVCCYATYGLGASYVPMYEKQLPKEWKFILEDSGSKICIAATQEIYEQVKELQSEVACLERVLCFELPEDHEDSYAALLATGSNNAVEPLMPESTDTAGFIYTSGTTGKPKGVVLTHGNITSNLNSLHRVFDLEVSDVSLAFMPWAHSMGQTVELHGMLSYGAAVAINDEIPNLLGNLADVKPTILFAVPRIFNRIYDAVNKQIASKPGVVQSLVGNAITAATDQTLGNPVGFFGKLQLRIADRIVFEKVRQKFGGRLRYAVSGSAALSKEVGEFIDALGIEVYEGYGLTETSPIATANIPGHRKIGSVGKPIPEVRIVIDHAVTDDPKHGEIIIYGPNVMKGYHNRPEENDKVMMDDGGFRSGDMGYLDDDGYLYISGRIKEQYKLQNGKYVVPSPLEEQLKLSPFVANIMIYGHNQLHNVALVIPDMDVVSIWAEEQGLQLSDDPASDSTLRDKLMAEVTKYGAEFKSYERPKAIAVLPGDFTTENGMLTPTLKLKRRSVVGTYESVLSGLYDA